jgi:deoxycytidine triphosphate deaminase
VSLLQRQEIEALLRAQPALIENFVVGRLDTSETPVRGATLDLTIGAIFVPGVSDGKLGGSTRGKRAHGLASGETAVVRTAEILRLPGNIAAIGFPPSTAVSLAGLLTTNPGHVDPGYRGQLHLTVINMAKDVFTLYEGQRILRLMLFRLAPGPSLAPAASPINEELLTKLSPDFLNVNNRVSTAIEKAGWRIQSLIKRPDPTWHCNHRRHRRLWPQLFGKHAGKSSLISPVFRQKLTASDRRSIFTMSMSGLSSSKRISHRRRHQRRLE